MLSDFAKEYVLDVLEDAVDAEGEAHEPLLYMDYIIACLQEHPEIDYSVEDLGEFLSGI